jgi:hemerythrin-like domain-containing protein
MSQSLFLPRRAALLTGLAGAAAAPLLLTACGKDEDAEEVGPLEDLMREHGVLRRLLIVYGETAARLRSDAGAVDAAALRRAAELFRDFGETYHEQGLEETYIFPDMRNGGGDLAHLADTLQAQHQRGREITAYILGATQAGSLGGAAEPLAQALDGFVRMYRAHAAREDTVLFPAWKAKIGEKRLDELGERFEQLEHQQFGEDGFEAAVKTVGEIEQALGLADLAGFTAPPPPAG